METTKAIYDKKLKKGLVDLLKRGIKNYKPKQSVKISKKYEKKFPKLCIKQSYRNTTKAQHVTIIHKLNNNM